MSCPAIVYLENSTALDNRSASILSNALKCTRRNGLHCERAMTLLLQCCAEQFMRFRLRLFSSVTLLGVVFALSADLVHGQAASEKVAIDAGVAARLLPHFSEQMFGSGRAILCFA
jgi:hypothetical protein